jgi:hypothetical protein
MDYSFLMELEKQLLQPNIRNDRAALEGMLHHDFFEFGASGKKWDRKAVIESLTKEDAANYVVSDFSFHPISLNAMLITYTSELNGQRVLRSSIWKESGEAWKLFFHQGTKTA